MFILTTSNCDLVQRMTNDARKSGGKFSAD